MATTRIADNTIFANVNAYKTFVQRGKDDIKKFSRIAASTARTFKNTSRDFGNRPA
jgi:predicted ATP-binding protein involved in virulence